MEPCRAANRVIASILFVAFLAQSPVVADEEEVLTNEDILITTGEGLTERVIIAKVRASETDFDISREQLVALSRAGVTAHVLEAMVLKSVPSATREMADTYAQRFQGTPCTGPGLYLEDADGALRQVNPHVPQIRESRGIFVGGAAGRMAIPGVRSDTRTSSRTPAFWFCPEDPGFSTGPGTTADPREILLVVLNPSEQRMERSFEAGTTHIWMDRSSNIPSRLIRRVKFEDMGFGVYRITPRSALDPGEYGFYLRAMITPMGIPRPGYIFAFGVD